MPTRRTSHMGENFVGEVEAGGVRSILGHQQASGKPRLDVLKARARGRRHQLGHQHMDLAV
jgi:hypothetical protein